MHSLNAANKKFFSYATVATMGQPAYAAVKAFLEEFYTVGPPEVLYKYDPLVDDLATEAARLIDCSPDEITYIKNTTEGINIACDALPLESGDEVLVQGNEYPANLLPWLKKRQDGVTVTIVKADDNAQSFKKLLESIGPKTKAITVSSAQYYDGFMADIATLSGICAEHGIFLVLDAVQTMGIRIINLKQLRVDILVSGGQKYLCAGIGSGFIYVNKQTLPKLRDTKVGIRSMEHFTEDAYTLKPTTARFQDGTQNLYGIVALHAALKHVNGIGIKVIEQKNIALLGSIKACLQHHSIPFVDHGEHQGNIVSMRVADPTGLCSFLKERGIYIKVIKDIARISFVHETRMEDVEALAELTKGWLQSHA